MEIEHRTKFLGTLAFLKYLRKEKCEKQKEKSNLEENIGNLVALKQQNKEKLERKNKEISDSEQDITKQIEELQWKVNSCGFVHCSILILTVSDVSITHCTDNTIFVLITSSP